MSRTTPPPIEQVLGSAATIGTSRIEGEGPDGRLPLDAEMLRNEPSGTIFGLTQNAGMGWRPDALGGPQYVIVSTMGGMRSERGEPIALGYHTEVRRDDCDASGGDAGSAGSYECARGRSRPVERQLS